MKHRRSHLLLVVTPKLADDFEAFRDLRHAGLTLAAQSGATLAEVMRRAGHSSSRAEMPYQHAAERRDAVIAERLSALGEQ